MTPHNDRRLACEPPSSEFRSIAPTPSSEDRHADRSTLDRLPVGQIARIVVVTGDDGISIRLMEMGLTEGEEIKLLGFAPLGDPIEFEVRGYRVSLRCSEARRIEVERRG